MSAILSSLKLVNAKRQNNIDPIQFRRQKLVDKLTHQIALANALKNGETYTVKHQQTVRDKTSGLTSVIEVNRKVKQWWWKQGSKFCLQIRYGNRVLILNGKDKNAIEVVSEVDLVKTFELVKTSVINGELDAVIQAASQKLRERFNN